MGHCTPSPAAKSALLAQIEQAIADVERSLARHLGDSSTCQLHKDGRVTGGLKYDEGRLVALHNLQRRVRQAQGATEAEMEAVLADEDEEWRLLLAQHQGAARPALPWVAYAQGGYDAVAHLGSCGSDQEGASNPA